ncbi:hypothetical protein [Caulobacter hibisci]|uniref:Transcriptional regulator n=1 Tax=Caulobacter hibisci TaxID=2035993 RepID=A0ABS0SXT3_9CAUL|nr:hypothetical protein [Caulobacter hibisci]MBI1684431.1 hypothetical protein [Caulobacter hibisci]
MTAAALSQAAVAQAVGLSRSRFAHVWRDLVADGRLPAPFLSGPGVHPKWDADAIAALKAGQHQAQPAPPAPAASRPPQAADAARLDRQRSTLRGLLQRQGA